MFWGRAWAWVWGAVLGTFVPFRNKGVEYAIVENDWQKEVGRWFTHDAVSAQGKEGPLWVCAKNKIWKNPRNKIWRLSCVRNVLVVWTQLMWPVSPPALFPELQSSWGCLSPVWEREKNKRALLRTSELQIPGQWASYTTSIMSFFCEQT